MSRCHACRVACNSITCRSALVGVQSIGWVLAAVLACTGQEIQSSGIRLVDGTRESGVDFVHDDGSSGEHYVVEAYTAGLALLDYDLDGDDDLYLLNGAPLPGAAREQPLTNALYRNNGDWTFSNVTQSASVGDTGYGLGVVAGDYDNDGDPDLYVSNFGPNVLYLNNADGTFTQVTDWAGVGGGERFGAGTVFLDIEADGDLDLFCANYQKFRFDQHLVRTIGDYQFHPGPHDYPPDEDMLFLNNGDGTFQDISVASGIAHVAGTGMGALATDVDQDGDTDLIVVNDSQPNFCFINDGNGRFSEQAVLLGLAYDRLGNANGNMGIDSRDLDGDGWLDLVTTTYQDELPVVYSNVGGFFDDVTNQARMETALAPHVNWGIGLEDFDNDADADLFIACGHFMDNIQYISDKTTMKVANHLAQNNGRGRWQSIETTPASFGPVESSRGAAFSDLDRDGDIDAVVLNANAQVTLLRNELPAHSQSAWLDIQLVGVASPRQPAAARVSLTLEPDPALATSTATSSWKKQTAALHLGRGYQSHYGDVLHFGLGPIGEPARAAAGSLPTWQLQLDVVWPSGQATRQRIQAWNRRVVIVEPASGS